MSPGARFSLALLAWLVPQVSWACDQLFVQVSGILGGSVDANHQGWIEAVGFSEAATRAVGPGGPALGPAQFRDLVIEKRINRASPLLRLAVADGRSIPQVSLDCVDASGASTFRIELQGVVLTQASTAFALSDQSGPRESVGFNFSRIRWTATDQAVNQVQAGWDRSTSRSL